MKSRIESTGNGNIAMHYGFQFHRRLKLSIDQVIRKYNKPFENSDVVELSNMTVIRKGDTLTKLPKRLNFGSLFTGIKTKGAFTRKHVHESTTSHRYQASQRDEQAHIDKEKVDISFSNHTTKSTLFIDVFTVEQLLKQVVDDFLGRMRRKVVELDYNFNKYDSKMEYRRYLAKKSIVQFTSDNNRKALTQYQRFPSAHNVIDTTDLRQNQAKAIDWPYKTDDKKSCARIRPFTDHRTSCARSRPYKTKSVITTQSHDRGIIQSSVNDLTQVLINYNQNSENTNFTGRYAQSISYSKQVHPMAISCARSRPYPIVDTNNFRHLGKHMPTTSDASQTDIKTIMSCARCKNFNFCKNTSIK